MSHEYVPHHSAEPETTVLAPAGPETTTTLPPVSEPDTASRRRVVDGTGLATLEGRDVSAWFGSRKVLDRVSLVMPPNLAAGVGGVGDRYGFSPEIGLRRVGDGLRRLGPAAAGSAADRLSRSGSYRSLTPGRGRSRAVDTPVSHS